MIAWMRFLQITLTSETYKKKIVIGGPGYKDQPDISVTGTKYLSPLKDEFVVTIMNVPNGSNDSGSTFSAVTLRDYDYRYIRIDCGYKSNDKNESVMTIFNGYIVYVSSTREDNGKTQKMVITCSGSYLYSNYVKTYFTLKKGMSYKAALEFAAKRSGMTISVDKTLKHRFLQQNTTFDGTLSSLITEMLNKDKSLLCTVDATTGHDVKIWNGKNVSSREIEITKDNMILTGGFPTVANQGISFNVLPFFNFIPGDVVIFTDASFINVEVSSLSDYNSEPQKDHYIDAEGKYIVKQIKYQLENRGDTFKATLDCYAKSLYDNLTTSS